MGTERLIALSSQLFPLDWYDTRHVRVCVPAAASRSRCLPGTIFCNANDADAAKHPIRQYRTESSLWIQ
jgi:hypothetical protein